MVILGVQITDFSGGDEIQLYYDEFPNIIRNRNYYLSPPTYYFDDKCAIIFQRLFFLIFIAQMMYRLIAG